MERDEVLEQLRDLAQLDVDAIGAYESAIGRISAAHVREKLVQFRGDHERHVRDLNAAIGGLGGKPIERKPDVSGFLIKGMTAVTSMMGDQAALTAMRGNEELTNRSYQKALQAGLLPDVRQLVERNFADEQRHLAWIKQALDQRLWEHEAAARP
jgi:rubrerythrin